MRAAALKFLAAVSEPLVCGDDPVSRPNLDAAIRTLTLQLKSTGRAIELHVVTATADNILDAIRKHGPFDVLYYHGHGEKGALLFEDGRGGGHPIDAFRLRAVFAPDEKPPATLVVLCACHSASVAPAFADAGVNHIVAIDSEHTVLDLAALKFTTQFYPALAEGKSVREAFGFGKSSVLGDPEVQQACQRSQPDGKVDRQVAEVLKFKLLPEVEPGDGDHHEVNLFSNREAGPLETVATFDHRPESIAARPEHFTGRERELHDVVGSVLDHKLTTVLGIGGMGKSELCREAGRWFARRGLFPGGIWFVPLGALNKAADALITIAADLKFDPAQAQNVAALARMLPRDSLLILDELDSLVNEDRAATRELVETLRDHGEARLLFSSRYATGAQGGLISLTRLLPPADRHLFLALAQQRVQSIDGTGAELAEVLSFLDGVPRAIVHAAAQMNSPELHWLLKDLRASKEEILNDPTIPEEELTDSDSVLVTLNSSYRRLQKHSADAAEFFPYLALFPAGISERGLREIFGERAKLIRPILERAMAEITPPLGYWYLPAPVRSFALRRMPPDALAEIGPRAVAFYSHCVDELVALITSGKDEIGAAIITFEFPNIEVFLEWGYEHETAKSPGPLVCYSARITSMLRNYVTLTSRHREYRALLERAFKAAQRVKDGLGEAQCVECLGNVARMQDRYEDALGFYEQALPIFRQIGDRLGEAECIHSLGNVALVRDRQEDARQYYNDALQVFREICSRMGEANCIHSLGDLALRQSRHEDARTSYSEALEIHREIGDRLGEGICIHSLGSVAGARNCREEASVAYDDALRIFRQIGYRLGEANTVFALGVLLLQSADPNKGLMCLIEAAGIYAAIGNRFSWARTKAAIGGALLLAEAHQLALAELEPAAEVFRQIGHPMLMDVEALIQQIRDGNGNQGGGAR